MEFKKLLKKFIKSDKEVLSAMANYLESKKFAKEVIVLFNTYFEDWASYLFDFNYDEDDNLVSIDLLSKEEAIKVFDEYTEEWAYTLEKITDEDDYHYNLYYKMYDYQNPYIDNYIPNIIETYLTYKLYD